MQAIAEISYLVLQYYTIASTSKERLPLRVHGQFFGLMLKYTTVIIIIAFHTAALVFMLIGTLFLVAQHLVVKADFMLWLSAVKSSVYTNPNPVTATLFWTVQIFWPFVCFTILYTNFLVVKDSMEGRYCPVYLMKTREENNSMFGGVKKCVLRTDKRGAVREEFRDHSLSSVHHSDEADNAHKSRKGRNSAPNSADESCARGSLGRNSAPNSPDEDHPCGTTRCSSFCSERPSSTAVHSRTMKIWDQIKLLGWVYIDLNVFGQPVIFLGNVVPLFIGVVELSRYGHKFDYVCAAKPGSSGGGGNEDEQLGGSEQQEEITGETEKNKERRIIVNSEGNGEEKQLAGGRAGGEE